MSDILSKLKMPPFRPVPFLRSGADQTIAAYFYPYQFIINNSNQHRVNLPDGDQIVLVENSPLPLLAKNRIVLLIHGLTGSHLSKYMIRMTTRLVNEGYQVFRMNLRGCGAGHGLAKHLYHSGRSEDARFILKWLAEKFPNTAVTQIGFSIGANITLKMAGEDGISSSGNCDSVIAVSPPLNLKASVKLIIHPYNEMFDQRFVQDLVAHAKEIYRIFPDTPKPLFPRKLNLYQFDDLYTAPRSGYQSANDYYQQCSSVHFLENIALPTFILHARDDPFISRRTLSKIPNKKNMDVVITKKGGHVGWIGKSSRFGSYRWMDDVLVKWVNWHNEHGTNEDMR